METVLFMIQPTLLTGSVPKSGALWGEKNEFSGILPSDGVCRSEFWFCFLLLFAEIDLEVSGVGSFFIIEDVIEVPA